MAVCHSKDWRRLPSSACPLLFCGAVSYCIVLSLHLSLLSLTYLHGASSDTQNKAQGCQCFCIFIFSLCCVLIDIGVTENTGTISSVQILFLSIVSDSNIAKGTLIQ